MGEYIKGTMRVCRGSYKKHPIINFLVYELIVIIYILHTKNTFLHHFYYCGKFSSKLLGSVLRVIKAVIFRG